MTTLNSQSINASIFDLTKIYEFSIISPGGTFYDYVKVVHDSEDRFKIYSYYRLNDKWNPCKTTRENKYDIIELDNSIYFKGPRFTEGPRKGKYDMWIKTNRIFDIK